MRRRRRRPKMPGRVSTRAQLLASVCAGLLLGGAVIWILNTRFRPALITVVSDHLSNQISGQICDVVNDVLAEEGISYDTICTIRYDASGRIAALQTDMARNRALLQNTITTDVAQEFDNSLIAERVSVPLGSLLPGVLFSGRGPSVSAQVMTVGNISAGFDNEFTAQGINQTIHLGGADRHRRAEPASARRSLHLYGRDEDGAGGNCPAGAGAGELQQFQSVRFP